MQAADSTADIWSLYLLLCRDGSLYVGVSHDVPARLVLHQRGHAARHTRLHGVEALLAVVPVGNRAEAGRLERRVKQMQRTRKLAFFRVTADQVAAASKGNLLAVPLVRECREVVREENPP